MLLRRFSALLSALWVCTGDALALGVATPQVSSAINEPLSARVALVDTGALRADDIRVALADESAYQALGLSRSAATDTLRLEIAGSPGDLYIDIRGRRALSEPVLETVLNLRWAGGAVTPRITLLPHLASRGRNLDGAPLDNAPPDGSLAALADPRHARRATSVPTTASAVGGVSSDSAEAGASDTPERSASVSPEARRGLESLAARLNNLEERFQAQSMAQVSLASTLSNLTVAPEMIEAFNERQQLLATRMDRLDERLVSPGASLASTSVPEQAAEGVGSEAVRAAVSVVQTRSAEEGLAEGGSPEEGGLEERPVAASASLEGFREENSTQVRVKANLAETGEPEAVNGTALDRDLLDDSRDTAAAAAAPGENADAGTLRDRLNAFWWLIALLALLLAVGVMQGLRRWRERGYRDVSVEEVGLAVPESHGVESDSRAAPAAAPALDSDDVDTDEEISDPVRAYEYAQARAICDEAAVFARHGRHEQARAILSAGLESYPASTLLARALKARDEETTSPDGANSSATPEPAHSFDPARAAHSLKSHEAVSSSQKPSSQKPSPHKTPEDEGNDGPAVSVQNESGEVFHDKAPSSSPEVLALLSPQEVELEEAQLAQAELPRARIDEIDTSGYHLTEFEYLDEPSITDDDRASASDHNVIRGMKPEALESKSETPPENGEAQAGGHGAGHKRGVTEPGLAFSLNDTDNDAHEAAPDGLENARRQG